MNSLALWYDVVVVLKAVAEIAGLALLGQGLLALLAGPSRETNVFYRVLAVMTSPVRAATRFITPRFVVDQHEAPCGLEGVEEFRFGRLVEDVRGGVAVLLQKLDEDRPV